MSIRDRAVRGGVAKLLAQGINVATRAGSLAILARMLDPADFGIVGMVAAVVGALSAFNNLGLSTAAVQRETLSIEQSSALFWINSGAGALLTLAGILGSSAVARFYSRPELAQVMAVSSFAFVSVGLGVQHSALLQRQMRFTTLAAMETASQLLSAASAVIAAWFGLQYWSLVIMSLVLPFSYTAMAWASTRWIPSSPFQAKEMRSILRFGGTVALNSWIVFVAYNLEKLLLGRFWGPEPLGLYGRAYQLANIPPSMLASATGDVAVSTLSRLRGEPDRFRAYFLRGYSLVTSVSLPLATVCALFAPEIIRIVLGPHWSGAVTIFRLLSPSILILSMINPLVWVLVPQGLVGRSTRVAAVLSVVVILGYLLGLSHGPAGVATGFSVALALWVIPHIAWCVHGTPVSLADILRAVWRPFLCAMVATAAVLGLTRGLPSGDAPIARMAAGGIVFTVAYAGAMAVFFREWTMSLWNLARTFGRSG